MPLRNGIWRPIVDWKSHSANSQHPRRSHPPAVLFVLAVFVVLGVVYSVVTPIFEAPDELQHFFYAVHLAEGGGLPRQDPAHPALWAQEGSQPPLYYALAALLVAPLDTTRAEMLVWENQHAALGDPLHLSNKNYLVHTDQEAWPYRGAVLAVHLMRWFSVLLGAATLVFVYLLGRALLPQAPRLALAAVALTALIPQFIFISSAVTNDNLIMLLSTVTVWLVVRLARQPSSAMSNAPQARRYWWAAYVALGLVLGAAALTKLSGIALWALVGGVLLLTGVQRGARRRTFGGLGITFGIAVAIAGWWYLRNWRLYGDPTGLNAMLAIVGGQRSPLGWRDLLGQFQGLRISYAALFGWFNLPLPDWVYQVLDGFLLLALLGLPLIWRRGEREVTPSDRAWLLLPVAWIGMMLVSLARWTLLTPGMQGRLLFPAAWAINLLFVLGWSRWAELLPALRWPSRTAVRIGWLGVPVAVAFLLAMISPGAVIVPAYRKPALITPAEVPADARLAPVTFGTQARLIGASLSPTTVRPDETTWVTLYWEVLDHFDRDYTVFVHLLDHSDAAVAQENSWPGLGAYPTRLWKPGSVIVDRYPAKLPGNAAAPSLLHVDVGFFDPQTGEQLSSRAADGSETAGAAGQLRLLPGQIKHPEPTIPLDVRLGDDGVRLLGYDPVTPERITAGQPIDTTLYWTSDRRPTQDYTVFVHLRGPDETNLAQTDHQPLVGAWPTSVWEPGQPITDRYTLMVPEGTPPGRYTLWAGMYRLVDLVRLPLSGTGFQAQDNALFLGEVVVGND